MGPADLRLRTARRNDGRSPTPLSGSANDASEHIRLRQNPAENRPRRRYIQEVDSPGRSKRSPWVSVDVAHRFIVTIRAYTADVR